MYCTQSSEESVQSRRMLANKYKYIILCTVRLQKRRSIKDSVMERGIIIYAISTILILNYVSYISGVVHLY